jgi:hypothetical protein
MNRDESLQRAAAHPPKFFTRAGRAAIYPTETAGGSWLGVNDAGLCLCLLNWYAVARSPGSGRVSRGIIIPALLAADSLEKARTILARLTLAEMSPFRLLVFAPRERQVREIRWDKTSLDELPHSWEPRHWFSSGFDEPRAQHERGSVAREAWREPRAGSLPWLRRLHASHEPARGPFCVCMHRRDAATVSYTEIVVTRQAATMRYHPGPLCCAPAPATAHRLLLRYPCKESAPAPTNGETTPAHENDPPSLQSSRRPLLSGRVSPRGKVLTVAS